MSMRFEDLEFNCPHCGKTYKVKEFLEKNLKDGMTELDVEYVEECLFTDDKVRLSYPGCKCECDEQFLIDLEAGYCVIFDNKYDVIFMEGFSLI